MCTMFRRLLPGYPGTRVLKRRVSNGLLSRNLPRGIHPGTQTIGQGAHWHWHGTGTRVPIKYPGTRGTL
eukprot:900114-Rhodomonas_salina.4